MFITVQLFLHFNSTLNHSIEPKLRFDVNIEVSFPDKKQ